MKYTLIRHAPPCQQGICYGHSDIDVQAIASDTAKHLHECWLAENSPAIFSSPSRRCIDLANAIIGNINVTIQIDERLRELHFGKWEKTPWSEIPREELDVWGADWIQQRPPQGETFHELCFRIDDFLSEYPRNQNYWIVSHAGPIRIIMARMRQQDPSLYFDIPVLHLEPIHAP